MQQIFGTSLPHSILGVSMDTDLHEASLILVKGTHGDDFLHVEDAPAGCLMMGGAGDDTLIGSSFSDKLVGGKGDDILMAGLDNGNDTLIGGKGADHFVFGQPADPVSYSQDEIWDLHHGDVIDLSAIDANSAIDGDQAFTIVDHFSGDGGEMMVKYDSVHGVTKVITDIDANGAGDFTIYIEGDHHNVHHFVL